MVPLRAIVAVPELQLSTSWVDFGTCFVNQKQVCEVYLMNLSGCRSYWTVLTGMSGPPGCALLPAQLGQEPQDGTWVPCPCRLAPQG